MPTGGGPVGTVGCGDAKGKMLRSYKLCLGTKEHRGKMRLDEVVVCSRINGAFPRLQILKYGTELMGCLTNLV